jgi:hypothetical protein
MHQGLTRFDYLRQAYIFIESLGQNESAERWGRDSFITTRSGRSRSWTVTIILLVSSYTQLAAMYLPI